MKPRYQIAYRAGSDIGAKAVLLVITALAARRLSQYEFGLFGLATAAGWLLGVVTDAGIQLHVARAVAQSPVRAGQILRAWFRVRAGLAAAAFVASAIAIAALTPTPSIAPLLLLVACYLVAATNELLFYFFRAIERSDLESTIVVLQRAAMLIAALAVLLWHPTLTLLAAVMFSTSVVALAIACRLAFRTVNGPTTADDEVASLTTFVRDVLPIGAGIVLSAVYFRIDILLVELWRGTDAVAVYNAVFRLVEGVRLFPAAALAVALPVLCRAEDGRPLARVAAGVTGFGVAVSLTLWMLAGWIVPLLYGSRYGVGVGTFRILLTAFPLMSLNYALTHQLIGWDGHRAYTAVCAAALVVNLILNAALIPAWSIDGAAWATVGTELVVTAGCALALINTRRVDRLVAVTT